MKYPAANLAFVAHFATAIAAVLATGWLAPAARAQSFGAPTNYATGTNPYFTAVADFTGDGKADLVSCDYGISQLSYRRGLGTGAFGGKVTITAGNGPSCIVAADLNGDGKLDIIITNYFGNSFSVLLGNGSGGFAPEIIIPFATPGTIYGTFGIADMNGDGIPDLISGNYYSAGVTIKYGTGAGTFGPDNNFVTNVNPFAIAVGDLNLDGAQDVVCANNGAASYTVLLGTGTGLLGAWTDFPIGSGAPTAVALSDVTGDGILDVVGNDSTGNRIVVFPGDGLGGLLTMASYPVGSKPVGFAVGDVSSDGFSDIISADSGSNWVTVLLGLPGGTFILISTFPTGAGPNYAATADLNFDGAADLVVPDYTGNQVSVLMNLSLVPNGISQYGTGTAGCSGFLGMSTNGSPAINSPGLVLTCTNAPRNSLGLGIVTDSQDLVGTYLGGLGIKFHVDFTYATQLISFNFTSDAGGTGVVNTPVPNDPSLIGQKFYAQSIWAEAASKGQDCSHAPFGLVSSKGLSLTIQP